MNIRSLGRERQHGLHGMVVNVPIDVDKTVNQLPRTFLQSQTIQLQLFRKMSFQKPYLYETIRPNIVLEAARYLSNTEIFKQQKIALSVTWIDDVSGGETKLTLSSIRRISLLLAITTTQLISYSTLWKNC